MVYSITYVNDNTDAKRQTDGLIKLFLGAMVCPTTSTNVLCNEGKGMLVFPGLELPTTKNREFPFRN